MAYSKIIHNFATQKHKVFEEYLELSYPETSVLDFFGKAFAIVCIIFMR